MKIKFPQTLEAAQAADKSQWKIGDALVREAEDQRDGERGLNAVAEELAENGIDLTVHTLSKMRLISHTFPRNRRLDLPFEVHADAGNPDTLDIIVKAARRDGEKVTKWYVRDVLRDMREEAREEARREYEKVQAAARKEEQKARADEDKARDEEKAAQGVRERERAKQKKLEAIERKKAAQAKAKAAKSRPKRSEGKPPAEDQVSILRATAGVKANAGNAKRLANESKKLLGRDVSDLPPGIVAGLTDAAMSAANAWNEVAELVRTASSNKRGHLSSIDGGKSAVNE